MTGVQASLYEGENAAPAAEVMFGHNATKLIAAQRTANIMNVQVVWRDGEVGQQSTFAHTH